MISDEDKARIDAEIAAIEARTAAEMVVVVDEAACGHEGPRARFASAVGLAGGMGAALLGQEASVALAASALFGVAVFIASRLPVLLRAVVGDDDEVASVERAAFAAFSRLGVHRTAARAGVLVYVALAERRVRVVADVGAEQVLGAELLTQTATSLAQSFARDRGADGVIEALRAMGQVLADKLPRADDDEDELANVVS